VEKGTEHKSPTSIVTALIIGFGLKAGFLLFCAVWFGRQALRATSAP